MRVGDLNDVEYNYMYNNFKKLKPLENVKKCIKDIISQKDYPAYKAYIYAISLEMEENYGNNKEYTEVYKLIEECEPTNVYENMIEKINNAIEKCKIENIDNDFRLFLSYKDMMYKLYNCVKNLNKNLLLRYKDNEIFFTYKLSKETVPCINVEGKDYIFKIDYENPENGLAYYNQEEKIVINNLVNGKFTLLFQNCNYVLYIP